MFTIPKVLMIDRLELGMFGILLEKLLITSLSKYDSYLYDDWLITRLTINYCFSSKVEGF